ncbi:MAG: HAMP domain-containing histidine kinase [Spirochaetales bacterium]|nr:HAMP domain-containing histidine kinase [Spirochaetales bacterium]
MSIRSITCALLLALPLAVAAQNNAYDIDDECYTYFRQAEGLVGKAGFRAANDQLLKLAREKGDTKAETLYYVEELKNLTRFPSSIDNDAKVEDAHKRLKQVAKDFGYSQYFYYAYQLAETYYYNNSKVSKSFALAQEMHQHAVANNDEYGIWCGDKYLASIYIDQDDFVSAKEYLLDAIKIYHKSEDPIIRRQSPTRLYCDLADTYPVGNDTVGIYVSKGFELAKVHLDTLRCAFYRSKLAILDNNIPLYQEYRDFCLADPLITQISASAPNFFSFMDDVIAGKIDGREDEIIKLNKVREIKVIANVCEHRNLEDFAFRLEKKLVQKLEKRFSEINQSRLSELNITMGKASLSADLATTESKLSKVSTMVIILLGILLAGSLLFSLIYIYNHRKSELKDKKRIEELKEANEQVRLANEAKTRFVQNMSHEVRTPLNAIVGFSQLLSLPDGTLTPEEKEEFSGHIVNNSQMLTMLLNDILNASSMDKGDYKINYGMGECRYMCQAAMSSAEHRLQPGVSLTFEPDFEGDHNIWTDSHRVQQILINLLTNACKHTSQGSIVLRCSLKEKPGIVSFSVTDTGPGVPEDQAENIFNRFTKLNEFVQGTGLGLSICREIAERMEGKVYLDTTYKAGGARFVFEIPDKTEPDV